MDSSDTSTASSESESIEIPDEINNDEIIKLPYKLQRKVIQTLYSRVTKDKSKRASTILRQRDITPESFSNQQLQGFLEHTKLRVQASSLREAVGTSFKRKLIEGNDELVIPEEVDVAKIKRIRNEEDRFFYIGPKAAPKTHENTIRKDDVKPEHSVLRQIESKNKAVIEKAPLCDGEEGPKITSLAGLKLQNSMRSRSKSQSKRDSLGSVENRKSVDDDLQRAIKLSLEESLPPQQTPPSARTNISISKTRSLSYDSDQDPALAEAIRQSLESNTNTKNEEGGGFLAEDDAAEGGFLTEQTTSDKCDGGFFFDENESPSPVNEKEPSESVPEGGFFQDGEVNEPNQTNINMIKTANEDDDDDDDDDDDWSSVEGFDCIAEPPSTPAPSKDVIQSMDHRSASRSDVDITAIETPRHPPTETNDQSSTIQTPDIRRFRHIIEKEVPKRDPLITEEQQIESVQQPQSTDIKQSDTELSSDDEKPDIKTPPQPETIADTLEQEPVQTPSGDADYDSKIEMNELVAQKVDSQVLTAAEQSEKQRRYLTLKEAMTLQQQKVDALRKVGANAGDDIVAEIKHLLDLFGIPYITSPGEADSQCGALCELGLADAVATEDSDVLLFGANQVIRGLVSRTKGWGEPTSVSLDKVRNTLGFSKRHLVSLAMLVGSDYTEGLRHVGMNKAQLLLIALSPLHTNRTLTDKQFVECFLQNISDLIKEQNKPPDDTKSGIKNTVDERPLTFDEKVQAHAKSFFENTKHPLQASDPHFPNKNVIDAYLNPVVDGTKEQFEWGIPLWKELVEYGVQNAGIPRSEVEKMVTTIQFRTQFNAGAPTRGQPTRLAINTNLSEMALVTRSLFCDNRHIEDTTQLELYLNKKPSLTSSTAKQATEASLMDVLQSIASKRAATDTVKPEQQHTITKKPKI
eukprot:TRINITY_DN15874_c0_g1_i1.p1 TRINITY_DN15874_c0_g1~~TRINITY_DN15874_c0_g1_i1.p1  ORF type:complete len:1052 (+),score=219.75 TRINITY_DN15874_c0_g1_i1:403-3156(+)